MSDLTVTQLKKLVAQWQRRLGLGDWEISVLMDDEEELASCAPEWRYKFAIIRFNLAAMRAEPRPLDIVVHELVHCLLSAYEAFDDGSKAFAQIDERVTTDVSKALLDVAS